jgi:hypothetical protein
MKKRIVFTLILLLAIGWIGYTFYLTNKQHISLTEENFFSQESTSWFINRNDNCLPEFPETQIKELNLHEFVSSSNTYNTWKFINFQHNEETGEIRLLLEAKIGVKNDEILDFITKIGLKMRKDSPHKTQQIDQWFVKVVNSRIAISNKDIDLILSENKSAEFAKRINQRDQLASYNFITNDYVDDVYCSNVEQKTFRNRINSKEQEGVYPPTSDLDFYGVIPLFTESLFFLEKSFLFSSLEKWNDASLAPFIDKGIMITSIQNKKVVFIDVSGQYIPQEIIVDFALDKATTSSKVVKLNRSIGDLELPIATSIENMLVLSEDSEILENVLLAYQMGNNMSKTKLFKTIQKESAHNVHARWYNANSIEIPSIPESSSTLMGYLISSPRTNEMKLTLTNSTSAPVATQVHDKKTPGSIVWNFTLENKSSSFYQNNETVCVFNPDKKTVSIIDETGNVVTWVQLTDNIKTIHPMDDGYLIEQFNQLVWLSQTAPFSKTTIPFSGAIASTIASYIWKGDPSIALISDNQLYRISLKTSTSVRTEIPKSTAITKGQLHAFNNEGDLSFGLFNDSTLHVYNAKKETWKTHQLNVQVMWSRKINGKVNYLASTENGYSYQTLFAPQTKINIPIEKPLFAAYLLNNEPLFIFNSNNEVELYQLERQSTFSYTLHTANPEIIAPLVDQRQIKGLMALNGIQNEIEVLYTNSIDELKIKASKFIKVIPKSNIITFIDGQVVMYGL